ncbi:choice-of-anchor A family protein [Clostridium bornimense]|uniref:choice-of-anchor A family protein n=1 Tax=Clostridium bornimense TaxID=1216932 RepID=UPI001C119B49|nr:choice-of-anchor A family protein [Clostridium bornimense]MBU5317798.1 choice-of-anchor A family protein [Clostridium bornimense]
MKQKLKKLFSILMILCICLFSIDSSNIYANNNSNVLGTASDFSIFVINDHVHKYSDCTGRIAVGNNATYEHYSIGNSLTSSTTRSDLIVGNTLNAIGGNNFNGNTSIGTNGKVINYTMTNNNNVANQPRKENIINFNSEKKYLYNTTKELYSLSANGKVSNHYGQLNLVGSDSKLVVFNIKNEEIRDINGINIDVPETATVLINIQGKNVSIGNLAMFYKMSTPSEKVFRKWLWNFPEAENLNFYGISVKGSILAPHATFNATGSGNIEGTIILNNFYNYNSGFEVHNYPFNGTVPGKNSDTKPDKDTPGEEKPTTPTTPTIPKEDVTVPDTPTSGTSDNNNKDNNTTKNDNIEEGTLGVSDIKQDSNEDNKSDTASASALIKSVKTGDSKNILASFSIIIVSSIALFFLHKIK